MPAAEPDPLASPSDPANPASPANPAVAVWPTMRFADADAMIPWLTALGFTEGSTYRDETSTANIVHAEWYWPGGGGIMFGSARQDAPGEEQVGATGTGSVYLVAPDPGAATDRAIAVGSSIVKPVTAQDYGGVNATIRDPEGNIWSIGSYQPE